MLKNKIMQQLEQRMVKSNTPTDASQVRSNCGLSLNKEETLSMAGSKTYSNNPEVNQPQHTVEHKAIVYVLSIDGKPLMPCKPAKARKLLKAKKAMVVKMYPFTIKLNFECENKVQKVSLGIDSGYNNIGFSCTTEKKELIAGTVILDDRTSRRLTEKRMYRRGRRNKLWYREPRFLNRKKAEGWLPPSVQRRYDAHLQIINMLKDILPISKITIETTNFDIQKIKNPEIQGIEYRQGDLYGYQNMRSYLMARENGICQLCHKEFKKGSPAHIHHCKERSEQGSNRAENLAILHKKCHTKLHEKGLKLSAPKEYKANTFMSIVHKKFEQDIQDVKITFGYITFIERQKLKLEKSHFADAFVIAGGATQKRFDAFIIQQKHRNNRSLGQQRNGFAPASRKQRYKIQPHDVVWVKGKAIKSKGCQDLGKRVLLYDGKVIGIKNVERIYNFGSYVY